MRRLNLFARSAWSIGLVVLLTAIGVVTIRFKERGDEIAAASAVASNFASVIAEQVSDASLAIELSLREVLDHHIDARSTSEFLASASRERTFEQIQRLLAKLPQADVVTITDSNGRMIASTRGFPHPEVDLSDREYFVHLRDTATRDIYISTPVHNKVTGAWTVYFARRLQTPSGEFLGVAMIGVRPEVLVSTQHSLSGIPGQSFVLLRRDGVVFMRKPEPVDNTNVTIPRTAPWHAIVQQGGGLYRSPGYFDGTPRYVAVRPLARYPLVVNVAITEEAALAAWRDRSIWIGIASAIVLVMLGALLALLQRQFARMDVSQDRLRQRDEELAATNQRLEGALENMSQGLAMFDGDRKLVVANRQYAEMYRLRPSQVRPGVSLEDIFEMRIANGLFAKGSPEAYRQLVGNREPRNALNYLSDGRVIAIRRRSHARTGGWITTHEDVTEQIQGAARIEYMAMHDTLTGLANRTCFIEQLTDAIARTDASPERFALLLLDLDGFKGVNDAFGHGVGDDLLRMVAKRLSEASPLDVVARLGGDEFAILHICGTDPVADADALAGRLRSEIHRPFEIGHRDLSVSLSVGIALVAPDVRDVERVMRWADLALYRAKRDGRNCHRMFDRQMEVEFQAKSDLAEELRIAIDAGALEVHYQPIVAAATGEVVTMEALARWPHPERGMISPAVFVPLAEECGLVHALGEWVLRRACADAAAWPENVRIAVNASSLQIAQGDFVDVLEHAIQEAGLPAKRLVIEITESALLQHDDANINVLHRLHALGALIALDDFGTGYSSLSYLKIFPFDKVKIDKSFVDDVVSHAGCAAIIAATTMLARSFAIRTVAEGVETREQYDALRAAGVELIQGYYFARPAPCSAWRVVDGRIVLPGDAGATARAA